MSAPEDAGGIAPSGIAPHARQKDARAFEQNWCAPRLLRPHHKLAFKRYKSWIQGRDGTHVLCECCGQLFPIEQAQIHHIDHDRTNNQLSNLRAFCGVCNVEERRHWLSETNRSVVPDRRTGDHPTKTETENIAEHERERLIKRAPYTTQLKINYRTKALEYLIPELHKGPQNFIALVYRIEALTGCSHDKAIEYLDGWSNSEFAPFAKYRSLQVNDDAHDPTGEYMVKERAHWDESKYATDEYKRAKEKMRYDKGGPSP